jgi:glycosyltransferase involved in cell wall biosynthesis
VLVDALSVSEGGGRSYVVNLFRELARDDRGFHFTVLAQPGQLDGIATAGVEVRLVRLPRHGRVVWRVAFEELVMPFVARSFDLLYCVADLAPRFALAPTVVLLRNLNIYDRTWYDDSRTRWLERLVRWGLPGARRILFPTRAAADLISQRIPVPVDGIRVVHYGISLDVFAVDDAPARPSAPYLFLPAAVERHKNIEVIVDALPHVSDPELELWVAGHSLLDMGHRAVLERRAAAAGVGGRVRFLGPVPYRDVLQYYRGAAAFVFPSFIETLGHPLLEAMVVGTPAVVSDIAAFREIAGDAALYFAPDDPRALAGAIDALRGDPQATQQRINRGRERAAHFSWKASVDSLCRVFSEVLG